MSGILLNRNRQVPAEETPAFGGIAERFRRAGDLDRAIALCRDGLKRFPNQLSARVTLGWALLDKGQYDGARFELEQVLRKAPDNLAAIRGLAELHDRAEAAMSEAAQESWRSEQAGANASGAMVDAAEPEAAAEAVQTDGDQFAPIPVTFGSDAASHQPLDVVHTADHAEFALDAADPVSFEEPVDLIVTPVELEDPAAASMASAEPAPFFVVDPSEDIVDAEKAPETLADAVVAAAVETADAVVESQVLEQEDVAELASADGLSVDLESSPATTLLTDEAVDDGAFEAVATFDASDPAAELTGNDWAALTTLTDSIEEPVDVQVSIDASADWASVETVVDQTISDAPDADVMLEQASALPEGMLTSTADWVTEAIGQATSQPEALEDIDETAGLELADAIKALEQAARRVEAKLAPTARTNEPSASPDAIAAFEFIDASGQPLFGPRDTDTPESDASIIDTSKDGAFELVSPNLANFDLTPTLEADEAEQSSDVDVTTSPDTSFTPELAFDDEAYELAPEATEASLDGAASVADGVEVATPVVDVDDLDLLRAFEGGSDALGERVVDIAGLAFIEAPETALSSDGLPDAFVEPSDGGQHDAFVEMSDELGTAEAVLAAAEEPQDDAVAELPSECAEESVGLSALEEIGSVEVSADAAISTDAEVPTEVFVEVEEDDSAFVSGDNDAVHQADDTGEDEAISVAAFSAVEPVDEPVVPPELVAAADVVEEIAAIDDGAIVTEGAEAGDDETVAGELVHVQPAVALTAALLDVPAVPAMTPRARLQVRALERFLRQVRARQLELHSETVA